MLQLWSALGSMTVSQPHHVITELQIQNRIKELRYLNNKSNNEMKWNITPIVISDSFSCVYKWCIYYFDFNVYIDDLSKQSSACNTGCMIGNTTVNSIKQADDVVVISPGSAGLLQRTTPVRVSIRLNILGMMMTFIGNAARYMHKKTCVYTSLVCVHEEWRRLCSAHCILLKLQEARILPGNYNDAWRILKRHRLNSVSEMFVAAGITTFKAVLKKIPLYIYLLSAIKF